MASEVSVLAVIWEECVNEEICIKIPFVGKKCVTIKACVRLIRETGSIFVEVEAQGGRWRYNLANACYTVIEWGIARIRLCVEAIDGGARIVLEGCLGVDGVKKCWTLVGQDVRFFAFSDLTSEELAILGVESPEMIKSMSLDDQLGSIATPLTQAEIRKVTSLDE